MPDIDTDFCYERRDEVIEYVRQKYGSDRVAQIVTFGTMAARAAVRDVGRVMGVPLADVDRIAKLIPNIPTNPVSIQQAIDSVPELAQLYRQNPQASALLETAKKVEGLARHVSTHAAGVVIAPGPITDYAPLVKLGEDDVNTQYSMEWVEGIGLMKMDFLGLRTLTVIDAAAREIRRTIDPDFKIEAVDLDDQKTYALLSSGQTSGVFQLESAGMRRYIADLKPTRIEDLIAMVALYRPGPMNWIADFIAGKHRRRTITYLHPKLEPILEGTYGIAIYQEQVMQMCRDLAGYTVGQADAMRKVIGKKIKEKIPEERAKFVAGCTAHGIDEQLAGRIWQFIEPFAGYGFPKAHSVCYALLAYRTAWLKANHPLQFMAALLTSVKQNTDKVVEYLAECASRKVRILPPDVNESGTDFTVAGDAIRFGLGAVRNVGEGAIAELLTHRERGGYAELADLCTRVDTRQVNRRVLESLTKAGALDALPGTRAQKLASLDAVLEYGQRIVREREIGQTSLFGGGAEATLPTPELPVVAEPPAALRLAQEKEAIGFYVSGHPLAEKADSLARRTTAAIRDLRELAEDDVVTIGGVVIAARRVVTKSGGQMLVAKLEDLTGAVEVLVFPNVYQLLSPVFVEDSVVVVKGRVRERRPPGRMPAAPVDVRAADDDERADVGVQALEAWPLEKAAAASGPRSAYPAAALGAKGSGRPPAESAAPLEIHVKLPGEPSDEERLRRLREIVLASSAGNGYIVIHANGNGAPRRLRQSILVTPALRAQLASVFGFDNVWDSGA